MLRVSLNFIIFSFPCVCVCVCVCDSVAVVDRTDVRPAVPRVDDAGTPAHHPHGRQQLHRQRHARLVIDKSNPTGELNTFSSFIASW